MVAIRFAVSAALVLGLVCLVACKGKDDDKQKASNTNSSEETPQQPSLVADEDDENPAEVNATASESPAPLQAAGHEFVYNFDSDSPEQLPQKFHSAITGSGREGKWLVIADPTPPQNRTWLRRPRPTRPTTGSRC
jgi:hypothetical protein